MNADAERVGRVMAPGPPAAGRVALRFDTLGLVLWPGIFGMLPTFVWSAALVYPLAQVKWPVPADGALGAALMAVLTAAGMFVVLVGPGLTAGLVQRARQPQPARIEWDAEKVVEYSGDWARTTIPWSRLHVAWQKISLRLGSSSALQLRDRESGALMHVWALEPSGVAPVRRRVYASVAQIGALVEAIEAHDPDFAHARTAALESHESDATVGAPDWSLAAERWEPRWMVRVGRLGYVGGVIAALLAMAPPEAGRISPIAICAMLLSVVSAGLLVIRARPVLREWRDTARALAELPAAQPAAIALAVKRRAVRTEAMLRSGFVAMTIYATVASAVFSWTHP